MTQALDANIAVPFSSSRPASALAAASARDASKFGTFAVGFGIAFAILYTLCERQNWPVLTYHPAVGRLDWGRDMGVPEDGPPMFWYGWLLLAGAGAALIGYAATKVPRQLLYRLTTFCCVLAALWPICFALAAVIDARASFNAEFLRSVWVSGIPALAGALAVSFLASSRFVQRAWLRWLFLMPIGGLVILGYSLNTYFTR